MTDWTAGYVADIGYTFGYYTELNPQRIKLLYCRKNTKPFVSSHKTLFFRELSSSKTEGFFALKPENLHQDLYANLH